MERRVRVDPIPSLRIPNVDLSPTSFQTLLPISLGSKAVLLRTLPLGPSHSPRGTRLGDGVWNGHLSSESSVYYTQVQLRGGEGLLRSVPGGCVEGLTGQCWNGGALRAGGRTHSPAAALGLALRRVACHFAEGALGTPFLLLILLEGG